MSVYKEGFYLIGEIQQKSKQIFPDACDFGMPVVKDDANWNSVKQLLEWYGEKDTRKELRYETGITVTQNVSLMDEWNTGKTINFRVTYVTSFKGRNKQMQGYVYVELIGDNLSLELRRKFHIA